MGAASFIRLNNIMEDYLMWDRQEDEARLAREEEEARLAAEEEEEARQF